MKIVFNIGLDIGYDAGLNLYLIIIIIIIIFINCNWVVVRWQWLFYMHTNIYIKKSNWKI